MLSCTNPIQNMSDLFPRYLHCANYWEHTEHCTKEINESTVPVNGGGVHCVVDQGGE